ncbi:MAG: trehalose-phosphatase [Acidiferrobacter sp.]
MKTLDPHRPIGNFLSLLASARTRLLVLDYDGTLAPFTPHRDDAALYPGVAPLLAGLIKRGTHIAFITGRPALDLAERLPFEGMEIFGAHGHEYRSPTGTIVRLPLPSAIEAGLDQMAAGIEDAGFGATMERKHGTVAIHWRQENQAMRHTLEALAHTLSGKLADGILGLPFDGGFEFRAGDYDKGTALTHLLTRHPGAITAYLGDDTTDEDAFAALPPSGLGVLVRPELRATCAQLWLKPPEELYEFLSLWNAST